MVKYIQLNTFSLKITKTIALIGQTGYAPSNYLEPHENQAEQAAIKKARREKMMAERKVLRETVEAKRTQRKQLEEEVKMLEEVITIITIFSI